MNIINIEQKTAKIGKRSTPRRYQGSRKWRRRVWARARPLQMENVL